MDSVGSGASDDPLAQPTRARLFAHLAATGRPAGTAELADELGLHPSGVRVHLERLRAAGLIERQRVPQAVGRPRDSWSIASDGRPGGQPRDAYPRLARWLARSIPALPGRLREIEQAGRELGRELAPPAASAQQPGAIKVQAGAVAQPGAPAALGRTLTALGFAPQRRPADPGGVTFRLGSCPYREAVGENQPVVCAMHRGLTLGLLDRLDPGARLVAFVPEDPDRAGCRIEVAGFTT